MWRITGGVLVAALVLVGVGRTSGCMKRGGGEVAKASTVYVQVVGTKNIRPGIEAIGTLNPNDEVIISSEVDGILKDIRVDEGSRVTRGMVLARINDTGYRLNVANARAQLKQAQANLANLRIEHGRKKALFNEKLVTIQQFDDVSTRLTVAEQDLDRARVSLSLAADMLAKTTIRAPKEGVVKEKRVTTGDLIRAGMPLLAIVQVNPLKLSFTITEKDVGALKLGQDIVFSVDPFPGREFSGKLSIICPSLEERSRTLRAEATVPNDTLELKPGLFARLKIFTGPPRDAVVIPATCILYEGTKTRVFVQEGTKARERTLRLGGKYDDVVEVVEGLKGGERIITVGQSGLTDGAEIAVER
ncbi:MAG TPA: efflux RND transporter periplasmic adaptor subunit [Deltaproteobacteria bacterium]|nr:efflux RND transporter periplasmic adaptor subunit [Deltaproteobacteria bacterium]HOI05588.1 efflux RND transporter periplasmic adaptor subunit [Deltaproteobacteria bacterium]